MEAEGQLKMPFEDRLPTREEQLATLQNTPEFDVLVVGGGATGSGCALDAVTRSESNFFVFSLKRINQNAGFVHVHGSYKS